jgi:hypothetical protein
LCSSTQITPPTPAQIKADGVEFPGNSTTFTIGNLVPDRVYYGWLLAEDTDGNDSDITPSVPPSFQTGRYIDFIHDGIILDTRVTFTRASIGTRVNEAGLIEVVQNDIPRVDHDPITLAQKGLLIEEARTNTLLESINLLSVSWFRNGTSIATSTDFPIFASAELFVYTMTGNGVSGFKNVQQLFTSSTTTRTLSVYFRRGTNDFAQLLGGLDANVFTNFDLATRVVGTRGSAVTESTMQPWKDCWYRCTLTTSSSTMASFAICIVPSNDAIRNQSSSLATSIYIAGPQIEVGSFVTSYIPTTTVVTRAGDFASITGHNFSSWYNPVQGTFGAQFQTIYTNDTIIRYILTGNQNQLMYLESNNEIIASFDG